MYNLTKTSWVNGTWMATLPSLHKSTTPDKLSAPACSKGPDGAANGPTGFLLLTPAGRLEIDSVVGAAFSTPTVTNISPNGVFTIFGKALASSPQAIGPLVDNQLPTNLNGTCVESGTTKWNLYYVSPGQLNVLAGQLPGAGTVPVTVVTNCGTANEIDLNS